MREIFFVLKTFLITCAVVFLMQYKIGEKTADQHLNDYLQSSKITNWAADVGEGAKRVTASTYNSLKDQASENLPDIKGTAEKIKSTTNTQVEAAKKQLEEVEL